MSALRRTVGPEPLDWMAARPWPPIEEWMVRDGLMLLKCLIMVEAVSRSL